MTRFSQWQRLYSENAIIEEIVNEKKNEKKKKETLEKARSRYSIKLDIPDYEGLLAFVKSELAEVRDYREMPHPPRAKILQPDVVPKATLRVSEYVSVSVTKPNNCIAYKSEGKTHYGIIRQIYEFSNPYYKREEVLLVNPIENLFPKAEVSPLRFFRYILFLHKCVVGKIDQEFVYVSPKKVVSVAAYRLLPEDVFGIDEGGIVLCPFDYASQVDIM